MSWPLLFTKTFNLFGLPKLDVNVRYIEPEEDDEIGPWWEDELGGEG